MKCALDTGFRICQASVQSNIQHSANRVMSIDAFSSTRSDQPRALNSLSRHESNETVSVVNDGSPVVDNKKSIGWNGSFPRAYTSACYGLLPLATLVVHKPPGLHAVIGLLSPTVCGVSGREIEPFPAFGRVIFASLMLQICTASRVVVAAVILLNMHKTVRYISSRL